MKHRVAVVISLALGVSSSHAAICPSQLWEWPYPEVVDVYIDESIGSELSYRFTAAEAERIVQTQLQRFSRDTGANIYYRYRGPSAGLVCPLSAATYNQNWTYHPDGPRFTTPTLIIRAAECDGSWADVVPERNCGELVLYGVSGPTACPVLDGSGYVQAESTKSAGLFNHEMFHIAGFAHGCAEAPYTVTSASSFSRRHTNELLQGDKRSMRELYGFRTRTVTTRSSIESGLNANRTAWGPWETFSLRAPDGVNTGAAVANGAKINLRTVNGFYVVAEGGGGSFAGADRATASTWERFTIQRAVEGTPSQLVHGDIVTLRASSGHYLSADGGGGGIVTADRTAPGLWEMFMVSRQAGAGTIVIGESIALRSLSGHYLVAEGGGGTSAAAATGFFPKRAGRDWSAAVGEFQGTTAISGVAVSTTDDNRRGYAYLVQASVAQQSHAAVMLCEPWCSPVQFLGANTPSYTRPDIASSTGAPVDRWMLAYLSGDSMMHSTHYGYQQKDIIIMEKDQNTPNTVWVQSVIDVNTSGSEVSVDYDRRSDRFIVSWVAVEGTAGDFLPPPQTLKFATRARTGGPWVMSGAAFPWDAPDYGALDSDFGASVACDDTRVAADGTNCVVVFAGMDSWDTVRGHHFRVLADGTISVTGSLAFIGANTSARPSIINKPGSPVSGSEPEFLIAWSDVSNRVHTRSASVSSTTATADVNHAPTVGSIDGNDPWWRPIGLGAYVPGLVPVSLVTYAE